MKILSCLQRSDEWFKVRSKCITASNASRLLTMPKCQDLAREMVAELWGGRQESYASSAMQWGIDHEDDAIAWYWLQTKYDIKHVGFCIHDDEPRWGASPDGLCNDDGLVEVKCPSTKNHLLHIEKGPPANYMAQMQWQLLVTGRDWCDFVSYDPRAPIEHQLYVQRVLRDEYMIENMADGAKWVMSYIDAMMPSAI